MDPWSPRTQPRGLSTRSLRHRGRVGKRINRLMDGITVTESISVMIWWNDLYGLLAQFAEAAAGITSDCCFCPHPPPPPPPLGLDPLGASPPVDCPLDKQSVSYVCHVVARSERGFRRTIEVAGPLLARRRHSVKSGRWSMRKPTATKIWWSVES